MILLVLLFFKHRFLRLFYWGLYSKLFFCCSYSKNLRGSYTSKRRINGFRDDAAPVGAASSRRDEEILRTVQTTGRPGEAKDKKEMCENIRNMGTVGRRVKDLLRRSGQQNVGKCGNSEEAVKGPASQIR